MEKTNHRWAWLYTQCSGMKLHHNTTRDKCNKFKGCLRLHGEVYFFAYRCGPPYCRLELDDVISHTPVTVHLEYRCTSHIRSENIQPHHAITPRPALADDPVSAWRAGLLMRAPAYPAESLQLVRDVDARGHLHSADSMTLVVPVTVLFHARW